MYLTRLSFIYIDLISLINKYGRGMVGSVPVFQPGAVRNFNFFSGTRCVSFFVCTGPVLSVASRFC